MTERRLLDGAATDFEASLLKSAINEAPSPELSAKMMAPLAAGAAVGGTLGAASLLKWAGLGAGALVLGGAVYLFGNPASDSSSVPEETGSTDHVIANAPSSPSTEDQLTESSAPASVAEMVHQASQPVASKREDLQNKATQTVAKSALAPDTLAEEMRLLDRARSLLKSAKDPQGALSILNEYQKKYPQGKLRPEATVLRVSALEASGAQEKATELKDEFLRAHPQSAHKKQLETKQGQTP